MMDSGNSGSLQSSSGGDDEYDSRAATDSVSAFMGGGSIPNSAPAFFDPLSNYSSLLNPSMVWPRASTPAPRPDPNPITHDMIMNPMLSGASSFLPVFQQATAVGVDSSSPTLAPPPPLQNQNQTAARNPKKRSRASRRAPTTVLTTDTTNFRAMVQEFTGIPAPPFNNNSPFQRSRLDVFGTRSTSLDAAHPPPYLRRPFAQKAQPPLPFLASSCNSLPNSADADAMAAPSTTTNNNIITTTSSVSSTTTAASSSTPQINYQLPLTQSSNLFNLPNPFLTSLLQTNPKFPFSNPPAIGSKPQNSFEIPSNDQFSNLGRESHLPMTLNTLQNLITSDQIPPQNCRDGNDNTDSNNAARWDNNPASPDGDKDNLRPISGGFSFPRNTINGKMNYSASSMSGFNGEKGPPENVAAARGEGMVESWICSSSE
ncbi:VQ motif-containing protein 22 [Sesamum alatum]|uniref:VQ motif-containing protein 22 n=1 Tax=Sesamum alatum TaxID=300844 RepID=A0AAE1XSC9_9LAMI|nr:VQ motif-containing protein 22 [Sesamum alatum]